MKVRHAMTLTTSRVLPVIGLFAGIAVPSRHIAAGAPDRRRPSGLRRRPSAVDDDDQTSTVDHRPKSRARIQLLCRLPKLPNSRKSHDMTITERPSRRRDPRGRPRRCPHSVDRCAALDATAAAPSRSAAATVSRSEPIRPTGRLGPHLDPVDGVSPDRRSAWRAPVGVDGADRDSRHGATPVGCRSSRPRRSVCSVWATPARCGRCIAPTGGSSSQSPAKRWDRMSWPRRPRSRRSSRRGGRRAGFDPRAPVSDRGPGHHRPAHRHRPVPARESGRPVSGLD